MKQLKNLLLIFAVLANFVYAQPLNVNYDTVKAQPFDNGKMWTFDFPPTDYFSSTYNFNPTQEWYDDVRLSSLRFGMGCSASFITEDGMIITNFHCSENLLEAVQKEGEDFLRDGYVAADLDNERKHPNLFVDQLIAFTDVTKEISDAFNLGSSTAEKNANKAAKIKELEKSSERGVVKRVITFYNGGRYSLYTYKRYSDIRLVLVPEFQLGMFGGDPDNYTYPRYSLDYTLWRAYEDGQPVKMKNYFKMTDKPHNADEVLFVVGNPGRTNKQKTVAQLEYMRDYSYFYSTIIATEMQEIYREMMNEFPAKFNEYQLRFSGTANGTKRYAGVLRGLNNPMYMARKKDFEKQFKTKVLADSKLKSKYADLWDDIQGTREEIREVSNERYGYIRDMSGSRFFMIAQNLYDYATQMKLPEEKRRPEYRGDSLKNYTVKVIFPMRGWDQEVEKRKLRITEKVMSIAFGSDNEHVKALFGGNRGREAEDFLYNKITVKTKKQVDELVAAGPDAILAINDPLMNYIKETADRYTEIVALEKEVAATEAVYEEMLGRGLYEVYGTSIPPDGTGSLRISDGVLKSYEYNGTLAPLYTTFYGLFDRYYSFNKKFPWNLPKKWENADKEMNLSTPFTFISTHDIVGGSSGSPVINPSKEFVGIAFDGNIESNAGYFIFDTEVNRMITVSALGIMESIRSVYKSERILSEIKLGRIGTSTSLK